MRADERDQERRGPRGGNSGMSIPPGADLDHGYATDDWPMDVPPEADAEADDDA